MGRHFRKEVGYMKKVDFLTRAIEAICAALIALVTILTFVQVIRRFIFSAAFPWAEEIAIYIMIWITFLGAVLCLRNQEHTRIDAFINLFPIKIRKWIEAFDLLVCFAFMMILCYHSIPLLKMMGKFTAAASKTPMYLVYSAILVSGILMIPYFIILIIGKVKEKEPAATDAGKE